MTSYKKKKQKILKALNPPQILIKIETRKKGKKGKREKRNYASIY